MDKEISSEDYSNRIELKKVDIRTKILMSKENPTLEDKNELLDLLDQTNALLFKIF